MKHLLFSLIAILATGLFALQAEDTKKVVFLSGKPSHGPMAHEHRAGNMLLAKRLNDSGLLVEAVVLPDVGYPADSLVLKDAATIVVFCTGHKGHLLNPKLEEFDALMKKGTGVVMIHWATEAQIGMPAKKFLEWMGGYCDLNWSVNPHWKPNFATFPDHPIANGLEPFSVHDEWYYHMRFVGDLEGVTPILSDLPPPETLKRPDGERSGNPDVRRAVANGESQHVAWAYERPDGNGRGFGFTGAHNHESWKNDNFRKVVLNAILWTAQVEVPANGVDSPTPSEEELKLNLDEKPVRKPKAKPEAPEKPAAQTEPGPQETRYAAFDARLVDQGAAARFFKAQRELQVVKLDSSETLNTIVNLLSDITEPAAQKGLLRGMLKGFQGRRAVAAPDGWSELSADIPETYQLVTLHTKDGQVLGGMVKQEDDQRVVLNMVGQSTTVLKSDIEKREVSPMSMMPEGLLNALQDEQVRDLVKYLQTTEQVDLPK